MKIEVKDNTQQGHMIVKEIPDRLYIGDSLWVSTAYGEIKIGVVNGEIYKLSGEELIKVSSNKVGVIRCHQ